MKDITKAFPGVRALDGVSFDLRAGEIHALVGENGAGKSTLMKILGGVYQPDGGEIRLGDSVRNFASVRDAEQAGVAVIFQELSLVRELSVAENIYLGREPRRCGVIRRGELFARAQRLLDDSRLPLDVRAPVRELGIGEQQLVEIAKALSHEARILILDEPTAALTETEVATLSEILASLRKRGVGMIYISHKLAEIERLADRVTILRDGKTIGTFAARELDQTRMISLMVGREVNQLFPSRAHQPGEVVFEARHFTVAGTGGPPAVEDVSFSLRRGEVLGIAGLMGAGRSELLMGLFGATPDRVSGEVLIDSHQVHINHPRDAIAHGLGFVTEDRQRFGLILGQSVARNTTLAALRNLAGKWLTSAGREATAARDATRAMRVKAATTATLAGTLSGGNQQKVVLAKWLLTKPRVLFLDEPTRGIDVGAKQEIYALTDRLASEGLGIVLVSSELPEVLGLSDRIVVMRRGRIAGEFTRDEATPERVMAAATWAAG